MASSDKIRIVVPAFNAGETILKCVEAITNATTALNSCEIIIVDNGKNFDLEGLLYNYNVKILKCLENGSAAYARNQGANHFHEGIIVFIDSDVICEKTCIKNLIAPLQKEFCQATIGNYSDNLDGLNFPQKYKQLYIKHIYDRTNTGIKNDFWTAISAVDAKVFHSISGFNNSFKGANGEDQEFGIRLTKNNYKVLSVADAVGQHINPYTISKIIRNDLRKGVTAVLNSLNNSVYLTDNRHANKVDILSVAMAMLTLFFFVSSVFFTINLYAAIIFAISWYISRFKLAKVFYRRLNFSQSIQATFLMFVLDVVRALCVFTGFLKYLLKAQTKTTEKLQSA